MAVEGIRGRYARRGSCSKWECSKARIRGWTRFRGHGVA